MNIAIVDTHLLTFQNATNLGIIDNGAIGISESQIDFIGKTRNLSKSNYEVIIDGSKKVTMPGLVNAHTHTGLTLLRGGAQDLPEIEWMNKGIGPLARHLTPDDYILGSKLGVLEGIRSGTTTFNEYAKGVGNIVEKVYQPFKIRVVATETINEVSSKREHLKPTDVYEFDKNQGEKSLINAINLHNKFAQNELVNCMFGPQALDMISLELLQSVQSKAEELNSTIHMHIAQGNRERLQIQSRFGKDLSTVKVLKNKGFLTKNLLAVHCHDTTSEERKSLVKSGSRVACCPNSISMIDGIVPPVGHFFKLNAKIGLGSDQAPGPGLHNIFSEMRTISILTKTMERNPTILPAWEVLQIGTRKGAEALGLESKIGTLSVGKKADLITIDLENLNLVPSVTKPFRNYIPNLIYSSSGYEVDNVIINGNLILENNQFTEIEEDKIKLEAQKRARKIFEDATEDWVKADSKLVKNVKKGLL